MISRLLVTLFVILAFSVNHVLTSTNEEMAYVAVLSFSQNVDDWDPMCEFITEEKACIYSDKSVSEAMRDFDRIVQYYEGE